MLRCRLVEQRPFERYSQVAVGKRMYNRVQSSNARNILMITVRNLSYTYPKSTEPVLKDLSFQIGWVARCSGSWCRRVPVKDQTVYDAEFIDDLLPDPRSDSCQSSVLIKQGSSASGHW